VVVAGVADADVVVAVVVAEPFVDTEFEAEVELVAGGFGVAASAGLAEPTMIVPTASPTVAVSAIAPKRRALKLRLVHRGDRCMTGENIPEICTTKRAL
jgi:hypothetical protein